MCSARTEARVCTANRDTRGGTLTLRDAAAVSVPWGTTSLLLALNLMGSQRQDEVMEQEKLETQGGGEEAGEEPFPQRVQMINHRPANLVIIPHGMAQHSS